MSTRHAPRERVLSGVWTPRLISAEGVYLSSRTPQDYLVYRNLTDADGMRAGRLACFCIGFRMKQLKGEPADCIHVRDHARPKPARDGLGRVLAT